MKELLLRQIHFEYLANKKLLASMQKAQPLDERALLLFSHLLSSSSMWISRIRNTPITTTLFQERTLEECSILAEENNTGWLSYLDTAGNDELNRIVPFIFPIDGSEQEIAVSDAILHIVHHSSYHRGQIVARLKGSLDPLPLVTYIAYALHKL